MKLFVLRDEDAPAYDSESQMEEPGAVAESPVQQRGYLRLHREVIAKCGIGAAAVYGVLEDLAQIGDRTGMGCVPSHAGIARELGISVKSVQRHLHDLREAGFVTWEDAPSKAGTPNRYYLPIYRGSVKKSEGVGQFDRGGRTFCPTGSDILTDKQEPIARTNSKNVESIVRPAPDPRSARLFEAWYSRYPSGRKNRKQCQEEWARLKPDDWQPAHDGLDKFLVSEDWREPRFIVHAHRWLKNRRWEEDPTPRQVHRNGSVPREARIGTPEWAAATGKAVL